MHLTDDGVALMLSTIVAKMPSLTPEVAGVPPAAAAPEP